MAAPARFRRLNVGKSLRTWLDQHFLARPAMYSVIG
jgi:hypothetical protein